MSKPISDIRLYQSHVPNVDGNAQPTPLDCRTAIITARRIALKLREHGFSLGDFDHLYLNFTTCLAEGDIRLAQRSMDQAFRWFRFIDVGVPVGFLEGPAPDETKLIAMIGQGLLLFAADASARQTVMQCVSDALAQGEHMRVLFRTKQASSGTAVIFLRILDSGLYHPLLEVHAPDGSELLRTDLPPCLELHALGEIALSRHRVVIKPRKNAFTARLSPLIFPLS